MTTDAPAPQTDGLEPLSAIEARILGCLIEKEATTPENYPLTANSVQLACNQKNNRDPVMELEPGTVAHALREMEGKRLIRSEHGARAERYEHRFAQAYSVTTQQQALLSVMLLRGPQTISELFTRCERLAKFQNQDEVRDILERLIQRTPAFAVNLGRAAGQREDRYMHLLCGPVSAEDYATAVKSAPPRERTGLEARIDALESTVASLQSQLDELRSQLG